MHTWRYGDRVTRCLTRGSGDTLTRGDTDALHTAPLAPSAWRLVRPSRLCASGSLLKGVSSRCSRTSERKATSNALRPPAPPLAVPCPAQRHACALGLPEGVVPSPAAVRTAVHGAVCSLRCVCAGFRPSMCIRGASLRTDRHIHGTIDAPLADQWRRGS
eukprot:5117632-Prymnesium_polylepis.2